eukprot:TRINITY_DN2379_c0_g1_i1.p1 TRINITY_DN2379_c0_g1~~TRINITY_DN2379_c0_g1_i1.p1  ORF type:complete len:858 (-),score=111.25 TRINITY_DN2379_c0_g1_i1:157-2730(-)
MANTPQTGDLIPPSVVRSLTDKLYERRKLGALEIEQMVKTYKANDEDAMIRKVVRALRTEFVESTSGNSRKGGLIAMAATALGLGVAVNAYLDDVVPPVVACFDDPDHKVRYYACESLYNISKVSRGHVLKYFNPIFDGLCKMAADPDKSVKDAADLLDRLLKDIIGEGSRFNLPKFIPLLSARIHITIPEVRRFLVSWIRLLAQTPDVELIRTLPSFLDGLFKMLSDRFDDIRQSVDLTITEFLMEIKEIQRAIALRSPPLSGTESELSVSPGTPPSPIPALGFGTPPPMASTVADAVDLRESTAQQVTEGPSAGTATAAAAEATIVHDAVEIAPLSTSVWRPRRTSGVDLPPLRLGAMTKILIPYCRSKDEFTVITCLKWIYEFLTLAPSQLFPLTARILNVILIQVSSKSQAIETASRKTNRSLQSLVANISRPINLAPLLEVVSSHFRNELVTSRLYALKWILVLHAKSPEAFLKFLEILFPPLLKMLSDPAEEVVRLDLEVLAKLSANEAYFGKLMVSLVTLFRTKKHLLEGRATLIVRQLCLYIRPEEIYCSLAKIVEVETGPVFASQLVQTLNLVLLTAPELVEVKNRLRALAEPENRELFQQLYSCWCHNETAVFSLCLLSQVYQHASNLVLLIAEFEMTVNVLMELDKLVQLLESPIFMVLRLHLLEPKKYPYLFKALFGILMLLPQSSAFTTLRTRLDAVSSTHVLQNIPSASEVPNIGQHFDFEEMLEEFRSVRTLHSDFSVQQRLEAERSKLAQMTSAAEHPPPVSATSGNISLLTPTTLSASGSGTASTDTTTEIRTGEGLSGSGSTASPRAERNRSVADEGVVGDVAPVSASSVPGATQPSGV